MNWKIKRYYKIYYSNKGKLFDQESMTDVLKTRQLIQVKIFLSTYLFFISFLYFTLGQHNCHDSVLYSQLAKIREPSNQQWQMMVENAYYRHRTLIAQCIVICIQLPYSRMYAYNSPLSLHLFLHIHSAGWRIEVCQNCFYLFMYDNTFINKPQYKSYNIYNHQKCSIKNTNKDFEYIIHMPIIVIYLHCSTQMYSNPALIILA